MPLVPMPGAVPRGWSFRQNTQSNRTLESMPPDSGHENVPPEMESVVNLPNESNHQDTPFRDDFNNKQAFRHNLARFNNQPRKAPQVPVRDVSLDGNDDDDDDSSSQATFAVEEPETNSKPKTEPFVSDQPSIALFGATGVTGGHFLNTALDCGYKVQCLPEDDPRVKDSGIWTFIKEGLENIEELKKVVRGVDYVVIMLNDVLPTSKNEYPEGYLAWFVEQIYFVLRDEPTVKVVLFQVR